MSERPSPPPIGFQPDLYPPEYQHNAFLLSYAPPPSGSGGMHMPQPLWPNHFPTTETSTSLEDDGEVEKEVQESSDEAQEEVNEDPLPLTPISRHCWQVIGPRVAFPYDCAIRAGTDADGSHIYAGRAFHEGDLLPAKVIPGKNVAYVCHGGEEVPKEVFDVLRDGQFVWEFATNGTVPEGAVEMGCTADGEKLYMGRAIYGGAQTPGKLQSSHGCLYIPFGGAEVCLNEYEVLVSK